MYKLCKTEQSASRQRELEKGLFEELLVTRYEDITVSGLCEKMNIPRKSFYRYFSSKDGALYALLDHTMLQFFSDGFRSAKAGTALGDLQQFFFFWHEHRNLLSALDRSQLSGIMIERATILARRERLMPMRMQGWSSELQELALSFAVCGLISMVFQWHRQGYRLSVNELTSIAITMLTKPLVNV